METNETAKEYTKPELAELFGVTTQAVDKKLNKLNLREKGRKDESKRLWIPADVAQLIADEYGTKLETGLNQEETVETVQRKKMTAASFQEHAAAGQCPPDAEEVHEEHHIFVRPDFVTEGKCFEFTGEACRK